MSKLKNIAGMGIQQQGTNDCWFASYLMVENYGKNPKDTYADEKQRVMGTQQYQNFKNFTKKEPFQHGAGEDMIQACLQDKGLHYRILQGNAITSQAVEQAIAADHPVIMGRNIGQAFGHFVVAVAIDNAIVTYIDPLNPTTPQQKPFNQMNLGSIMIP